MKYFFFILIVLLFTGCSIGHQGFIDIENDMVGNKLINYKPYKYKNAGEIIRANYLKQGQGFTHITKDKYGNNVHHYFIDEVLNKSNVAERFVGKCLIYKVIDVNTGIVLSWGFDKGGNPQSCRIWP